jgi:hypothetical protein
MKSFDFRRFALSISAAIAFLAGCGGSQPPIGAPGTMPQGHAIATHAQRGGSWMLPEAQSEDLLYAAATESDAVYVFAYRTHKLVGTLTGLNAPLGLCADQTGNVWIVNGEIGYPSVVEYAHGGTSPIATLYGMGPYPNDCAVDPTTGNLAVSGWASPPSVAIYADAKGQPTVYNDYAALYFYDCTYDSSGNLYVSGASNGAAEFLLAELPAGSADFSRVTIDKQIRRLSEIQWDGTYIAIADSGRSSHPRRVYRVSVSDGIAKVIGSFTLLGAAKDTLAQPWIGRGDIVFNHQGRKAKLSMWKYPRGGKVASIVHLSGGTGHSNVGGPGVVLSLAPSGKAHRP